MFRLGKRFAQLPFPIPHSPFPIQQIDERAECYKLPQRRHVDAVAVGVANRRRGRGDHDPLRSKPVEHRKDRVLHRVAAHYRVVEHDERIVLLDEPVGHVVDMLVELAPCS